ncbi:S8 family serine peptidase [Conexibacter sp. SYSU D00693]|uniref:S8 family serine peptidase n=1 Tax=Conexibacter sp. SYSU D00693 TaxID=2812560 RepID=UPI00196B2D08|nr:S8 family serine peptidase [Conexibacter sp. SYSU D00693]
MRPALLALAAAGALLGAPAAAHGADAVPGEVVVATEGHATAAAAGGPQFHTVRTTDVQGTIRRLRRQDGVRYAVRNVKARAAAFMPDDVWQGHPWPTIQWNFAGPFGVNAPAAWEHLIAAGRPGGAGVVVAVLDTGVAYRQRGEYLQSPDLDPAQFVAGYDFVDGDPYANDANGHGTHVASTIGEQTNNGTGLTGLAYGTKLMPVRVLDDRGEGDAATIAKGVRYAARRGAQVINLSLEFSADVRPRDIPQLLDAIDYAHGRGAVIVGASGNEADAVAYPARAAPVISVGSTTEHGCLSDFSNRGFGLDLVAPGGGPDELLAQPECRPRGRRGQNIAQITLVGKERRSFGIPGNYKGTSMAVPHVSAAAALVIASGVLGERPSPVAVERRLETTARDLGPTGRDRHYGAGLLDAGRATDPAVPVTP